MGNWPCRTVESDDREGRSCTRRAPTTRQAAAIADAIVDPGAEGQLLEAAGSSLAELQQRCARTKAAATDLEARRVAIHDLRKWTAKADPAWLGGVEVVATDLAESFRAGLSAHLGHARPGSRSPPRGAGAPRGAMSAGAGERPAPLGRRSDLVKLRAA